EPAVHARLEVYAGVCMHVDCVCHPLAGLEVVDDVTSAGGVGRDDDVDVLVGAVLATLIARRVVVIGDAFAAQVEVLRLEAAGNREGCPGKGRGRGARRSGEGGEEGEQREDAARPDERELEHGDLHLRVWERYSNVVIS